MTVSCWHMLSSFFLSLSLCWLWPSVKFCKRSPSSYHSSGFSLKSIKRKRIQTTRERIQILTDVVVVDHRKNHKRWIPLLSPSLCQLVSLDPSLSPTANTQLTLYEETSRLTLLLMDNFRKERKMVSVHNPLERKEVQSLFLFRVDKEEERQRKRERGWVREWERVSSLVSRSRLFPDSLKLDKTVLFPFLPFLHPSPPPVNDCFTILSSVSFLRFTHHSIFVTLGCCLFLLYQRSKLDNSFFHFSNLTQLSLWFVPCPDRTRIIFVPVNFRPSCHIQKQTILFFFLDETWNGQKFRFSWILFRLDTNKLEGSQKSPLEKGNLTFC